MARVSVAYEYTAKNGRLVCIKPNESFILISKTNEHWWHVRKDQHTKPFYVPAQYMRELPVLASGPHKSDSAECLAEKTHDSKSVMRTSAARDDSKEMYRFSTFGLCLSLPDVAPCGSLKEGPDTISSSQQTLKLIENPLKPFSIPVALSETKNKLDSKPHPADQIKETQLQMKNSKQDEPAAQLRTFTDDEDFPLPPPDVYDTLPEIHTTECDFSPEPPDLDAAPGDPASQQRPQKQTLKTTANIGEQAQNENLQTAVYVNVAQLRQSISESPPPDASPRSPSYLDQEEWEVHVDQESGQEYYYHPATGRTTWDNPFLDSPTDPDCSPAEEPYFPSPLQSPDLSASLPPGWASDWEKLVDETSGCPYFYNPMSGETSWEPPEQSPYPPLLEPMSVHRFHNDGPPPLPEEDYPPEDYPGADQTNTYEELQATGPTTLPKEYALSHVDRTVIPRANLDRSTPPGWNLNVDPNGTWVFSSQNSPDEWIKSVDDQGQTYYYLRDGTRSQWNLPEAPAGPSHSRLDNHIDNGNVPVIKHWRDSKGPSQFPPAFDDGRFIPTHVRNTSDYSSDCSSTGNSPETQHFAFGLRPWRNPYYLTSRWLRYNVQNLEKAGILNKTKVSENGKKVRKNWSSTWTVLHGGVLTFHKDPKSTVGTVNKTNQIVPEVTVELKGATIGWATKDKSSKKNVLELKGKNGMEFLLQYDTESIINDWHKILMDTIRQMGSIMPGCRWQSENNYGINEYQDHRSEEEDGDAYEKIGGNTEREDKLEKRKSYKVTVTPTPSNAGETDQKKVRTKLMKLLMKRPTLQSVKEKGYIRENVFGCHLATLCALERTTVPSFVEKCIKAVENRGLDIDGLYRVNGNLAIIQKLRYKADHEELDLEDGQWEDVHVVTGALKLFFRELPEPLFPYSHFNNFISAIRNPDYKAKFSLVYELVKSLPAPNHDTMDLLFGHLQRLIKCGEENRMTVQNVAIVFGPTLLRPEEESSNITMHMVFQNQIVEFILNEYNSIFYSQ
nr:rho GTPase-activating protein 27 isoform X1 [Nothobranchius furzeri]